MRKRAKKPAAVAMNPFPNWKNRTLMSVEAKVDTMWRIRMNRGTERFPSVVVWSVMLVGRNLN